MLHRFAGRGKGTVALALAGVCAVAVSAVAAPPLAGLKQVPSRWTRHIAGGTLQLVAVVARDGDTTAQWRPDGLPVSNTVAYETPAVEVSHRMMEPFKKDSRLVDYVFRFQRPPVAGDPIEFGSSGANTRASAFTQKTIGKDNTPASPDNYCVFSGAYSPDQTTGSVNIEVTGAWVSVAKWDNLRRDRKFSARYAAPGASEPHTLTARLQTDPRPRTAFDISTADRVEGFDYRFVALDKQGQAHQPTITATASNGRSNYLFCTFDKLPLKQVGAIDCQVRLHRTVEFKNIPLLPH